MHQNVWLKSFRGAYHADTLWFISCYNKISAIKNLVFQYKLFLQRYQRQLTNSVNNIQLRKRMSGWLAIPLIDMSVTAVYFYKLTKLRNRPDQTLQKVSDISKICSDNFLYFFWLEKRILLNRTAERPELLQQHNTARVTISIHIIMVWY